MRSSTLAGGVIISALYGLLDAEDPIRNYELSMDDSRDGVGRLYTWWKRRRMGQIVSANIQYIMSRIVHDLLPGNYRKALAPWPPDLPGICIRQTTYPGQGSGSIYRRGDDLQRLLLNE